MAEWTAAYINDLPDSAFAVILPGGEKDDTGRTVPRSLRKLPHHNVDGAVDLPHLRNALAREPQTDMTDAQHSTASAHLERHAEGAGVGTKDAPVTFALKRTGRDTIYGLAIPFGGTFGGRDIAGETFDANSDLCIEWFGKSGRPVIYDHGLHGEMKTSVVGRQTDYETKAEGIFAESQLKMNAMYRRAIDELLDQEALGYSSGAMPHLAKKNARTGVITQWPWVELSLTPIPAEPSTLGVHYIKSATAALDLLEAVEVVIPDPLKAALAALDQWAETRDEAPAASTYADDYDRLLVSAKAFVDRSSGLVDLRAKSGRVLSAANRDRLVELRSRIASASEHATGVLQDLDELLTATDPDALADAEKALRTAVFEALLSESRALGVEV